MMVGMLLAIIAYRPIYSKMFHSVNLKDKVVATDGVKDHRKAFANDNIAGDSIVHYSRFTTFADGTLLKTDSIIHTTAADIKPVVNNTITVNSDTRWHLVLLVFIQVIFVTMVYGPIAAFLVEMFPIRIRYTSMSLPYHIGNGIFGGLLPAVATYLVTNARNTGHIEWYLQGLWYPIIVAGVCFVIGMIYLDNNKRNFNE